MAHFLCMYFETVHSIYSLFNRHSSPFSARLPNYLHVHIIIACDEEDVTSKLVNRTYEKSDENAKEKDYLLGRGVCMCVCAREDERKTFGLRKGTTRHLALHGKKNRKKYRRDSDHRISSYFIFLYFFFFFYWSSTFLSRRAARKRASWTRNYYRQRIRAPSPSQPSSPYVSIFRTSVAFLPPASVPKMSPTVKKSNTRETRQAAK